MFYTIYQISHNASKKIYIGKHKTDNLQDDYMGSGKIIRRAIARYGIDAFTKTILHVFNTEEEMDQCERELVTEEFCRRKDTYNICEGGRGGFSYVNRTGKNMYGKNGKNLAKVSERGRKSFRRLLEDPKYAETYREKVSCGLRERYSKFQHPWQDKHHTVETKRKIGQANAAKVVGVANGRYGTCWITNGVENKVIRKTEPIPDGWAFGRKMK